MSISFGDAQGNLFNTLGKLGSLLEVLDTFQDDSYDILTLQSELVGELSGGQDSDLLGLLQGFPDSIPNQAGALVGSLVRTLAPAVLNRIIFRDNPQPNQTETQLNIIDSIKEVIRQMEQQGATVLAQTVTATASTFTGDGNGSIVVGTRRASDGKALENMLSETLTVKCSADSYVGGATEGQETFTIYGRAAESDVFSRRWPAGSSAQESSNAVDGSLDNDGGNLLSNSGFDTWAGGEPEGWNLDVGEIDVNIFEETSLVEGTGSALRLTGDSSGTLVELAQQFNAGNETELESLAEYAFNVFVRRDGTAAAAGTMVVELVDENGTVIQDEAGNDNSFTIDLTALDVFYQGYGTMFRTPRVLPATIFIRYRLSTALTNERSVYFDRGAMAEMSQLYTPWGPFVAVFSGGDVFQEGDQATITTTNSRGAGGTLHTWQTLFARLFQEMETSALLLPSSGTPSISDDLIG